MPKVLVVDDESGMRLALKRGLTAEGLDVVLAADGPTALHSALHETFDVIVLDVILPGLSGYRVLEQLRADGIDTPILLISAKDGEVDQADGLDLGADGYLVKPFSFVVLLAQVRALLRRRQVERGQVGRRLRVGPLVVDTRTRQVSWAGRPVDLSARELALLDALAARPDTVLSRDELLRLAWGGETAATRNAVEVYISYLRRKLDAAGAGHLVRTVRGRGYKMDTSSFYPGLSEPEPGTGPVPDPL
jgi:DNA-binding response OmpR family regulator